jgi:hypothetical protein
MDQLPDFSVFKTIGDVLGYPAMLLVFWLYTRVKDMQKRLDDGDSVMKEMSKMMNDIRVDVSVIRDRTERNSGGKDDTGVDRN